jgi:hypothetical protein
VHLLNKKFLVLMPRGEKWVYREGDAVKELQSNAGSLAGE